MVAGLRAARRLTGPFLPAQHSGISSEVLFPSFFAELILVISMIANIFIGDRGAAKIAKSCCLSLFATENCYLLKQMGVRSFHSVVFGGICMPGSLTALRSIWLSVPLK
jgi:hypothetical protein